MKCFFPVIFIPNYDHSGAVNIGAINENRSNWQWLMMMGIPLVHSKNMATKIQGFFKRVRYIDQFVSRIEKYKERRIGSGIGLCTCSLARGTENTTICHVQVAGSPDVFGVAAGIVYGRDILKGCQSQSIDIHPSSNVR